MVSPIGPTRYSALPIAHHSAGGRPHDRQAATASAQHTSAVPNIAVISAARWAVTLIDCIVAMPCAAGRRCSAGITNAEKAKNTPPTAPAPTAAATVIHTCSRVIAPDALGMPHPGRGGVAGVVGEVAWRAAERALHAVGQVRVAPVEHLAEQVHDEVGHAGRQIGGGELGRVVGGRDGDEGHLAPGG